MEALLIVFGIFLFSYLLVSLLTGQWMFGAPLVYRLRGYTKIQLHSGQYGFNEPFTTYAKFDKEDNVIGQPYRYIGTNTGEVELNRDGTAEYCGRYRWYKI